MKASPKTNNQKRPPDSKAKSPKPRVRSLEKHRSFRLTKKRLKGTKSIPSALAILRQSFKIIRDNKRLFIGIVLIYSLLSFLLVQGLGSTFNIAETKQQLEGFIVGDNSQIGTSLALFAHLVGSFNQQASEVAGTYQMLLGLVLALASIWTARQLLSGDKPSVRDVFYKSMYPVIPFLLVTLVISIQLIPAAIGSFLFTTVTSQGLAVTGLEQILWFLIFMFLALLSLYMIISSLFALYIVTLPNMTPMKSLRSARELVLHRRLTILGRMVFLLLVLIIIATIIFVPLLMVAVLVVEPLFLIASGFGLVFVNVYMYNLYRALL